jgi:2-dehydropantoate 2-reductase
MSIWHPSAVPAIAILGPGGVGGLVAAMLVRAGSDVVVIGREPEVDVIRRDGISVESVAFGAFSARPAARTELTTPAAVLLVATKAPSLAQALERIQAQPELVVPLMNGLEHMTLLRSRFGATAVAAGAIRMEADRPEPGHVIQSSPAVRIELATDHPGLEPRLAQLADVLDAAGITTQIGTSEAQVLWSKLVRLNALAATTSAADVPMGAIREDPDWRATLVACVQETAAVANASGATIDPAASLAELDAVHPMQRSSMQRDIAAGREPELDAILGAVIRAAVRHGLECPATARLATAIAARAGVPAPQIQLWS